MRLRVLCTVCVVWLSVAATAAASFVNEELYPLADADGRQAVVDRCRAMLDGMGVCFLPDFLAAGEVEAGLSEVRGIGQPAMSVKRHTVWQQPPDAALPADHPRNVEVDASIGFIPRHMLPGGGDGRQSVLAGWYTYGPLLEFVAEVVAADRDGGELYLSDDANGSVYATVNGDKDVTAWHFDEHPFSAVVLLQAPESGGEFQYVAKCCGAHPGAAGTWADVLPPAGNASDSELRECYACVQAALSGKTDRNMRFTGRRVPPVVGSFTLFKGSDTLHQVNAVKGETERVSVVFAFSARERFANSNLVADQNNWSAEETSTHAEL